MSRKSIVATLLVLSAALSPAAHAITAGQVDTFSSGVQGWYTRGGSYYPPPGPPEPPRVQLGGPAGNDDAYLEVTLSVPQSGKPTQAEVLNSSQWAGNYQSAGVTIIEMDLINLGNFDLTFGGNFDLPIRLFIEAALPGEPPILAFASDEIRLPAGGPWMHVSFFVGTGALMDLGFSAGEAAALLANVTALGLTHTPFAGELQSTVLGVDNVRAVPEPATVALMLCGLVALWLRRR